MWTALTNGSRWTRSRAMSTFLSMTHATTPQDTVIRRISISRNCATEAVPFALPIPALPRHSPTNTSATTCFLARALIMEINRETTRASFPLGGSPIQYGKIVGSSSMPQLAAPQHLKWKKSSAPLCSKFALGLWLERPCGFHKTLLRISRRRSIARPFVAGGAGEGEPSWMVHCERNTLQHFDSHHGPPQAR